MNFNTVLKIIALKLYNSINIVVLNFSTVLNIVASKLFHI